MMTRLSPTKLMQVLPDGESVVVIDESTGEEVVLAPTEQVDVVDFLLSNAK